MGKIIFGMVVGIIIGGLATIVLIMFMDFGYYDEYEDYEESVYCITANYNLETLNNVVENATTYRL